TQTVTLNLNGGAQLGKGTYRLFACGALLSAGAMIHLNDPLTGGFEVGGVDSFRTFTIVLPDLTATKTNNVGGTATLGSNWNGTITVNNGTPAPATFADGQTILSDNLPNTNVSYGSTSVVNSTNIGGTGTISCGIVSNDLTCTASGGTVIVGG